MYIELKKNKKTLNLCFRARPDGSAPRAVAIVSFARASMRTEPREETSTASLHEACLRRKKTVDSHSHSSRLRTRRASWVCVWELRQKGLGGFTVFFLSDLKLRKISGYGLEVLTVRRQASKILGVLYRRLGVMFRKFSCVAYIR